MAGFENDVVVGKNLNFDDDGAKPHLGIINAAGKFPIGTGNSSPTPEILGGSLTSPNNSIIFGYSSPNITATVNTDVVPDLHTAKWIVNPVANSGGNSTTIQSAIDNAVSGETVFIMAKSTAYAENLALKPGVNLAAFGCDAQNNVTITGKMTYSGAGMVSISGIFFKNSSDFFLVVSGNSASVVNFNNCRLSCVNNTGISFTSSSASASISLFRCIGTIDTTGITFFASSSAGLLSMNYTTVSNTGASTTASTISAGSLNANYCTFSFPITSSGSGSVNCTYCTFTTSATNTTCLTLGVGASLEVCRFASGSASAISIGGTTTIVNSTVASSNTNPISGAGTLNYTGVEFSGSGHIISTTTQSYFQSGTFTPTLTGSATAGTTTYSSQAGNWSKVGNLVQIDIVVAGSAATGTGNATIGGLPFAPIVGTRGSLLSNSAAGWAWPAGTTMLTPQLLAGNTTMTLYGSGTASLGGPLQMVNASFNFQIHVIYQI